MTFGTHGAALQALGYTVTPTRGKAPFLNGWQKKGSLDSVFFQRYHDANVGLVLGVAPWYLVALDIDSEDADFAQWCEDLAVAMWGFLPVRLGAAPRRILLVRVGAERHKLKRGPLEVLGTGQQCVVYGTHPTTGAPYAWTDVLGGLLEWAPADVPLVPWAEDGGDARSVLGWLETCSKEAARRGLASRLGSAASPDAPPGSRSVDGANGDDGGGTHNGGAVGGSHRDPLQNYAPATGLSIAEARQLLGSSGLRPEDYDDWLKAGMALHHEWWAGGASAADPADWDMAWLDLWDEWSSTAPNYAGTEDLARRWDGFTRSLAAGQRGVTLRTLIAAAKASLRPVAASDEDGPGEGSGVGAGSGAYPRTEAGNAARLVDAYGRDLLWCADFGQWYRWSGRHWRAVSLTEVRHLAKRIVEDMRDDLALCVTDREKADHMKWCAGSQRWTMYDHMVSIASLDESLWVRAAELDSDVRYLGVQNGVVDLWTGGLLPPDRSRRVTKLAAVAYQEGAECPLFEATVRDAFEHDAELVGFFQRLLGYAITGDPREHLLVLPHGGGGNGKSTIFNAVQAALGDHAATAHASVFLRDVEHGGGGGSARPDILALAGARFVLVSEPKAGAELREDVIKAMAGGDVLPARALYSSTIVQLVPTWTAFVSTNHKPIVRGDDVGIWRRLLPIPFVHSFENDPRKDVSRPQRLREEAPGILAWLVRGAMEYRRVGLCPPGTVAASRAEYRSDMDLLAEWLAERCQVRGGVSATLDALWLDWEPWARARGELRFLSSRKALSRRLSGRGFAKEKGREGAVFLGLCLRNFSISEV